MDTQSSQVIFRMLKRNIRIFCIKLNRSSWLNYSLKRRHVMAMSDTDLKTMSMMYKGSDLKITFFFLQHIYSATISGRT